MLLAWDRAAHELGEPQKAVGAMLRLALPWVAPEDVTDVIQAAAAYGDGALERSETISQYVPVLRSSSAVKVVLREFAREAVDPTSLEYAQAAIAIVLGSLYGEDVREQYFAELISERLQEDALIDDPLTIHVLGLDGIRTEHWTVGSQIDAEAADQFFDPATRAVYAMEVVRGGEVRTYLVRRDEWEALNRAAGE